MVCRVFVPHQCLSRAPATSMSDLQAEAATAYADRDFSAATQKLNELVENEPNSSRWHEMRAQVLVDGKNFSAAVDDFDAALQEVPGSAVRLPRALPSNKLHCNACLCKHAAAPYKTPAHHLVLAGDAAQCSAVGSRSACHTAVALALGMLIAGLDCCQLVCTVALLGPLTRLSQQPRQIPQAHVWRAAGSECLTRVRLTTGCCRVLCTAALLSPWQAAAAAVPASPTLERRWLQSPSAWTEQGSLPGGRLPTRGFRSGRVP